jgi:malic enzyme
MAERESIEAAAAIEWKQKKLKGVGCCFAGRGAAAQATTNWRKGRKVKKGENEKKKEDENMIKQQEKEAKEEQKEEKKKRKQADTTSTLSRSRQKM